MVVVRSLQYRTPNLYLDLEDMKQLARAVALASAIALVAQPARAQTVVNFDDLPSAGTGFAAIPGGYQGINWLGGTWQYRTAAFGTATAHSAPNRAFNLGTTAGSFSFASPVKFQGAFFSGTRSEVVFYKLYLGATLVATSSSLTTTGLSTFLASGYAGNIDRVELSPSHGNVGRVWAMDNVTFDTPSSTVPEPGTMGLLATGLLGLVTLGGRARRRTR